MNQRKWVLRLWPAYWLRCVYSFMRWLWLLFLNWLQAIGWIVNAITCSNFLNRFSSFCIWTGAYGNAGPRFQPLSLFNSRTCGMILTDDDSFLSIILCCFHSQITRCLNNLVTLVNDQSHACYEFHSVEFILFYGICYDNS